MPLKLPNPHIVPEQSLYDAAWVTFHLKRISDIRKRQTLQQKRIKYTKFSQQRDKYFCKIIGFQCCRAFEVENLPRSSSMLKP